jgi:hypothetical protein
VTEDIYQRLAYHLSTMEIGCPLREDMIEIFRLNLSPIEAEVALALPTKLASFCLAMVDEISSRVVLR